MSITVVLADDLDVGLGLKDETQARTHHLLVVGQHHGDAHVPSLCSGRRARTAKPATAARRWS